MISGSCLTERPICLDSQLRPFEGTSRTYTNETMKCHRISTAILFGFSVTAYARDVRTTFDLLNKGRALSSKDAARLEDHLKKKPGDEQSRIQLLSYWAGTPNDIDLQTVKQARLRHILWLIENDPKDGLGLFQVATGVYRLHCQGDDLADSNGLSTISAAWLEQIRTHPGDAEIRRSAIDAIQYCSPEQAEQILNEANDASGLGRLYASAVLGITGESYLNNDPVGSDPAFRARLFTEKARRALEEARDKEIIVSAARTLLRQGAILWADGKLDWDYTTLGNALLVKAKGLAPDDITLLTLPTTLPVRGERPAATIRVGGNVQSAKLIRKVTPAYPAIARDRGAQGTVQMTALIGLDGKVLYLRAEAGPAELIPASLEAVRQWEYKTTTLNGKPCYVETRIDVNFTLSAF